MNVKHLREEKSLTQEELSSQTGIPRSRISKWEQGKGKPKADDLKTLENFFAKSSQTKEETVFIPRKIDEREEKETVYNLSESNLNLTRTIERLAMLLERQLNSTASPFPQPGQDATETLGVNKKPAQ